MQDAMKAVFDVWPEVRMKLMSMTRWCNVQSKNSEESPKQHGTCTQLHASNEGQSKVLRKQMHDARHGKFSQTKGLGLTCSAECLETK